MKDKRDLTPIDFQKFKLGLVEAGNSQAYDIFIIIFNTGLKMSEVLNLKFSDVDFKFNSISINQKRSETRIQVPMNDECMKVFRRLKDKYSKDVFVFQSRNSRNQKNKPASSISRQVVNKVFKNVSNSTSLPITMNLLREHYTVNTIKEMLTNADDSVSLLKIMDHLPINMTRYYLKDCNIKNNEELNFIPTPKIDTKFEIEEYLLNGKTLNESSHLDDFCQKCDISESDLDITLKTIKMFNKYINRC